MFLIHILSKKFIEVYEQNSYQNQISEEISGAMIIVGIQRMTKNIN